MNHKSSSLLIADSGSTKTDWLLHLADGTDIEIRTSGLNPVRDSRDVIRRVIYHELLVGLPAGIAPDGIYFYGAGCIQPFSDSIRSLLIEHFPNAATVEVESDLLGAARALCGHESGIACILGTGSNSCYYDGTAIARHVPPLGYILGDEGSGAVLGRTLVGSLLKGLLSDQLLKAFYERFSLTQADIIERVYRQPAANTFLASLVPFLAEHREYPGVRKLIVDCFSLFFLRNIIGYGHPELPVNFVGSIAYHFHDELEAAAALHNLKIGEILQRPICKLLQFHTL